jgi:hypothetical protein
MTVSPTVIIGVAWATHAMHTPPASRGQAVEVTRLPYQSVAMYLVSV